jgi:hypothetical protein
VQLQTQLPANNTLYPSRGPTSRLFSISGNCFSCPADGGTISNQLYTAVRDILLLTDIYNRAAHKRIHEQETTYFDYLATAIEYQLAELKVFHHNVGNLERMLTLAFVLINLTVFRNHSNISPFVLIVEERF